MSSKGYVQSLLNTLDDASKRVLTLAFEHVQDTFQLGAGVKATNARWYRQTLVTSSNAGTEFSFDHGLDAAPALLIPVLDLSAVGSQLVPLTVSRAPDVRKVYLTSTSTGATMTVYVE